jgi:hypothetical protein
MNPSMESTAQCLSQILLPLMRYRVSRMGVDASGAFRFYSARLETCSVFTRSESTVASAVAAHGLEIDEIHEIGCGWGQLVFLFAWAGYRTTGFEIDSKRFAGASYLRGILMQIDEERTGRATIRNEFFPPARRPAPRSLAIATNLVTDHPKFVEEQMLWGLRRYRYAVIDVDRFCYLRPPEERTAFLTRAAAVGLRDLGVFCDTGNDGEFHLFEQSGAP